MAAEKTTTAVKRNNPPLRTGKKRGSRLHPVRVLLMEENVPLIELAKLCNTTRQAFYNRFTNDDMKLSEMEHIAEVLGYEFTFEFKKKQNE